ncbi:hypothetical protein CFP56_006132 [Quercus suber]|uniref:Uncharacterized protein n=1 Tax=Quercus suber TaxID=58331 RepID=A0AAW0LAQ7_QUESU
MNLSELEER